MIEQHLETIHRVWRIAAAALLLCLVTLWNGCKTWPEEVGPDGPPEAQGTYVGSIDIEGGVVNMLLSVIGPDSADHYTGSVRYRSQITSFEDIYRTQTGDTLWFRYRRNETVYRAWALLDYGGLTVHFIEPSGISVAFLNRELDGYNLSGVWNGLMTSATMPEQRTASMSMDQQGQAFYGTVYVTFFHPVQLEITSGVVSQENYHLYGNMRVGTSTTIMDMTGYYYSRDTVTGYWQAGSNGSVDHGEYLFYRTYE